MGVLIIRRRLIFGVKVSFCHILPNTFVNHGTAAENLFFPGCVGAELLLGQPLFPGDSGVDQLVEIIKVSALHNEYRAVA